MSQQVGVLDITLESNADFSTKRYRIVKMGTTNQVALAAANTDKAIGVLQNNPGSGTPLAAVVRVLGTTKVVTGTPFSLGAILTSDTLGRAITATADVDWVIGLALEAGIATGDVVEVLIVHFQANVS